MTRTYAAKRLLEHGPLTWAEFREITGWNKRNAWRCLERLHKQKVLKLSNNSRGKRMYSLAD